MKSFITIALLTLSAYGNANDSLPSEVLQAYKTAYKTVFDKLGTDNFQVFYEYRIAYEDDQIIQFSFKSDYQNCMVEVRSESARIVSFTCTTSLKTTKGHFICDKENYYIILIEDGVFQLSGNSKFHLYKDWSDHRYNTYGTNDFISVTFTDETMRNATLEHGLLWPYGDVDESSVVNKNLTQSLCK